MFKFIEKVDLSGYTLVIPSISVGNVGQLAVDIVINSLDMPKIGVVYSPAVVPIAGYNPYDLDSKSLSASCELYVSENNKLAALQIRSPLVNKYAKDFLTEVVGLCKSSSISKVIILTGSFAHERHEFGSVPFRYVANEFILERNQFESLGWIPHKVKYENEIIIYGGGFAKSLQDICTQEQIPCLILFKYCSEGDNIPDAIDILTYLNKWTQFFNPDETISTQMKQPVSWNLLYGNPPPRDIY